MGLRNTITRAATATARKSGLISRCNLFPLVWQRFWLRFHVLWLLLCLSTSGNCKYSFCFSTTGKWREEMGQICFECGFGRKRSRYWLRRPKGLLIHFAPFTPQLSPRLSQPPGEAKPPMNNVRAGAGPERLLGFLGPVCLGWAVCSIAGGAGISEMPKLLCWQGGPQSPHHRTLSLRNSRLQTLLPPELGSWAGAMWLMVTSYPSRVSFCCWSFKAKWACN